MKSSTSRHRSISKSVSRRCIARGVLTIAACLVYAAQFGCAAGRPPESENFYFISTPNERQKNPDRFFGPEYTYLQARKGLQSKERPVSLLGLALSGGGMRSAAFQLGVLSGLHSINIGDKPALTQVDYVSSVSGGSWASGSYWSAVQSDDEFFACLDEYATDGASSDKCKPPTNTLRHRQSILVVPAGKSELLVQRKVQWETDIVGAHIPACNVDFAKANVWKACLDHSSTRPYPIFMSTHSSSSESPSATHNPFESTPHFLGTVVDEAPVTGFFLRSGAAEFQWELRKWQRYFALKTENRKDRPGSVLSLILAHSSGVVGSEKPFLLQYNFHAHYQDRAIKGIRRTYHLADGGKADNLGLLPLLERGVDTIVVSQMGKEGQDFGDAALAAAQAKRLFGCEFKSDWGRDVAIVVSSPYSCPDGGGGVRQGTLIFVRPTITNISEFFSQLEVSNPALFGALRRIDSEEQALDRFPETPTFRSDYPAELVRAYYLLGRHISFYYTHLF